MSLATRNKSCHLSDDVNAQIAAS